MFTASVRRDPDDLIVNHWTHANRRDLFRGVMNSDDKNTVKISR